MPRLALLTAVGGPIGLAEFPLTTLIFRGELPLFYPFAMGLLEVGNVGTGRTFELDPSVRVYGNKTVRGVMLYDPVTPAMGLSFLQHNSFSFSRLMPKPFHLADVNAAFASADAGLVSRGALVP
jgi:hypothetical protein